ncbi:hypothetical protein H8A95_03420 [Bradyrhizobium sp. Pear76]|uniref:hypothetical protein n=1 Tax=Bradyrhizobium oropedii TaxID=1571201 RepID=UPI001E3B4CD9|nr:hypothetical protein [Bradyrhizobium oropedii]MCC8961391.1 hypothetical protein [Bradyrhizobium oropedii]
MTGPRPKGEFWTCDDDRRLLEWSTSGVHESIIARKLKRTRIAVRTRRARLLASNGADLTQLQKFVELDACRKHRGRTAYALSASALPGPAPGFVWCSVTRFNLADEVLKDADLKNVFKVAIKFGHAIILPAGS